MKQNNYRRKWCLPICILIFLSLGTKARLPNEKSHLMPLSFDTLSCLILPDQLPNNRQFPVGYHFHILKEFAQDKKIPLHLTSLPDSITVWDALHTNLIRIVVMDSSRDTIPKEIKELVLIGPSIDTKKYVWVFLKEDFEVMKLMYTWLYSFKFTNSYKHITSRFFSSHSAPNTLSTRSVLSPYDELIKEYSKTIGWDWRLLASLIYQESNFRMNLTSRGGAIGLMQLQPVTVQHLGVVFEELLYDPEENIKAGTRLIKELSGLIGGEPLAKTQVIQFILAAYNAGYDQLNDCRNFAAIKGKNPNIWNEVVEAIPLMRLPENAHLVKRPFKGDQTIRYVEEVLERYQRYCEIISSI